MNRAAIDRTRRICHAVILAGLLGASAGCGLIGVTPEPVPNLVHSGGGGGTSAPFRRVVVMPIEAAPDHVAQAEIFRESFQAAIGRRNLFEAVPVSREDLVDIEIETTRSTGTFKTDDLILASRRFGADGVIYGVMTQFEAYPTIRYGLRLYLLDCRNGRVPWASEVLLDSGDRLVAQDVHNYHDVQLERTTSLLEHERILQSPRLFGEYAAHRISATLQETLHPRPIPETSAGRRPRNGMTRGCD